METLYYFECLLRSSEQKKNKSLELNPKPKTNNQYIKTSTVLLKRTNNPKVDKYNVYLLIITSINCTSIWVHTIAKYITIRCTNAGPLKTVHMLCKTAIIQCIITSNMYSRVIWNNNSVIITIMVIKCAVLLLKERETYQRQKSLAMALTQNVLVV